MVRVISAHHFASQHIQTVEQPTASTIAPPNRLLLALSSHCVQVRDLSSEGDVLFTFPTVDEVTDIIHCLNGNYVLTLETKYNYQNSDTNFVRIYVNWDSIATLQQSKMTNSGVSLESSECGMVQPMRARIAGRVTPTTNQSELGNLEMIEIPVKRNPTAIACCQVSGNILIQFYKTLNIYNFKIKVHDISKLKFIDFEELPIIIELCFMPRQIDMCENYIVAMNKDTLHMFRISTSANKESSNTNNDQECDFNFNFNQDETIDYKKLLMQETLNNGKSDNVTVNLPTIVRANSAIHKNSPFTFSDKELTASIKISATELIKTNLEVENLIQMKLKPIIIEHSQKQITEEFKCFVLKPLYVKQKRPNDSGSGNDYERYLKSDHKHFLNSVVCMIATQQEGYLYQFCDLDNDLNVDKCISVYSFTAPVYKLVMEDYFLHAITETGLETYTLRIGHQLCKNLDVIDNVNIACPSINDAICLIGMRQFVGIENVHVCSNYLVLLAAADTSPTHSASSGSSFSSSTTSFWTMYTLELPSPKVVFNDVLIIADGHRFTSAQTYKQLVSEAHMVLRLSLTLMQWTCLEGSVQLITKSKLNHDDWLKSYQDSCILLADHYIMCSNEDDYRLCVPYYKMGQTSPFDVLKRVKSLQEQSNNTNVKGLVYYLSRILLDMKHGPDAEKFFKSGSKQNFAEAILEIFEKHNFIDLPYLILKSNILKEFSTERLTKSLSNIFYGNTVRESEKLLALCVLYIQRCNTEKAHAILAGLRKEELQQLLLEHWELLFETTSSAKGRAKGICAFSELAVMLISTHGDLLAETFVLLIFDKHCININKVLKVFLEYLPSSIGGDVTNVGSILQLTLELYFKKHFARQDVLESPLSYDKATQEAMKFLVRSYLSQIQIYHMKEKGHEKDLNKSGMLIEEHDDPAGDGEKEKNYIDILFEDKVKKEIGTYLFANLRYEYLDKMPPFQCEKSAQLLPTKVEVEAGDPRPNVAVVESATKSAELKAELKKLQALLSSQTVPKQVLMEISTFLSLNNNLPGYISLQSLLMNMNDAITFLIDTCPQCLQQFGKDRFKKIDEWKLLIVTVQRRILHLSQNPQLDALCLFYRDLLKEILTDVAQSMNLDQLLKVFPQKMNNEIVDPAIVGNESVNAPLHDNNADLLNEIENYEPYITICKETMHANQIRKLTAATGQQLLCTLNL